MGAGNIVGNIIAWFNTDKDGSGTNLIPVVDSDGNQLVGNSLVTATAAAQATTASYVDLTGSDLDTVFRKLVSYVLQCTTSDSFYKILGSNDNNDWVEVVAETAIAAGASAGYSGDAQYRYYKIQIKENVAGGSVAAQGLTK